MQMRFLRHMVLGLSLSLPLAISATDNDEAMDMLERMAQAVKTLSYEGVFAYQSGKNIQLIQIYHRADPDGEIERFISLNGPAHELIRSNDMVTSINPQGKQLNVSRHPLARGFPSDLSRRLNASTSFYDVKLGDTDRIAGRKVLEIVITPLDEYRYGYRLWVDEATYLLLKSQLIGTDGNVLESFIFSTINTAAEIPDHKFKPQMVGEEITWMLLELEAPLNDSMSEDYSWHPAWLPEGFLEMAHQTRHKSDGELDVEQRVYSDGLSSVSVFVEKIRALHSHLRGASNFGAINAFGTIIQSHFVTVVGEVPARTVEKIGNSISFSELQP